MRKKAHVDALRFRPVLVKFNPVCRQTVTVNMENGLHLVPCSMIAQRAQKFECAVTIYKGDLSVDAKNIFDLMTLNASHGTPLDIQASGKDAHQAVEEIVRLFHSNFEGDQSSDSTSE